MVSLKNVRTGRCDKLLESTSLGQKLLCYNTNWNKVLRFSLLSQTGNSLITITEGFLKQIFERNSTALADRYQVSLSPAFPQAAQAHDVRF